VSLNRGTLEAVARLADEAGVLSVYATTDPRVEASSRPAWQVRVRNELAELRHRVRSGGDHAAWAALAAALDALEPDLAWLLDGSASGRGRALFAPLRRPEPLLVSIQLPLTTAVVLEPTAYLRPLVAAWGIGAPAGVVDVAAHGIRAIDYRFGVAEEVYTQPYEESTVDWRRLSGPSSGIPGRAQHSAPQRDLYTRRVGEHLARFLHAAAPRLAELAGKLEWEDLVVTGDPELAAALLAGLPAELSASTVTARALTGSLPAPRVAEMIAPMLDAARYERARQLAEQARDAALTGGPGAYGLGDTLSALVEGRVEHLLLDESRQWSARRAPDGRLYPGAEIPPGGAGDELVEEPDVAERMIELAYRQGGHVTLLGSAAGEPLAAADGIGAILRW
jgi:release factor family 10